MIQASAGDTQNDVNADHPGGQTVPRDGSAESTRPPKTRLIIPAFLCLLYLAQCTWFIGTQSLTNDEPLHIFAGLDSWRHGRFERFNDHPPLVYLLLTLPLLPVGTEIYLPTEPAWADITGIPRAERMSPSPEAIAWRARSLNAVLGVILGLLLWTAARRYYSEGAANFVLALFAFSPSLVAHFSVAINDGAVALLTFAAALQLVSWRRNPSWLRTVVLGLILGALLVAKFSTPVLFLIAVFLVLVLKPDTVALKPRDWNWRRAFAIMAVSFLVVWSTYFFHWTKVSLKDGTITTSSANRTRPIIERFPLHVNATFYVPAGEYVEGLLKQVVHMRSGHASFLLGQISMTGWKMYFPVAVVLKWPTVVLVLFLAAVVIALFKRTAVPRDWYVLAIFPGVFFLLSVFSNVDIGERHILLVYPFVLLFIAGTWQFAQRYRSALLLLVALVFVNAADCLRYAPGYLSYFPIFVNPATSYKLLSDSNLDWGQGLIALRKYQEQHPTETIHLAYFGEVNPALYGVRYEPLFPNERVSGTVVVSAIHLSGQLLDDPKAYAWTSSTPEKEILDHCLHVFEIPPQER
jgi:4-amino-4-deoxy-L-arabinose transferase-like glycosyltransferase